MTSITDVLIAARRGEFVGLVSDDLIHLIQKIDETGKKGKLTLTITIEPDKHGGREKKLNFEHSMQIPKKSARPAVFWSDDDGNLVQNDPDQRPLFENLDDRRDRTNA